MPLSPYGILYTLFLPEDRYALERRRECRHKADGHNEEVEQAPAVCEEFPKQVRIHVDDELHRKNGLGNFKRQSRSLTVTSQWAPAEG